MAHFVSMKKNKEIKSMWLPKRLDIDYFAEKLETVPFFSDWEIIETPGHTAADICLFRRKCGSLYVGDVVLEIKGKLLLPFPILFQEQMKVSLKRLAKLPVKKILPAHGNIYSSPNISQELEKLSDSIPEKPNEHFKFLKHFIHFNKASRKSDEGIIK